MRRPGIWIGVGLVLLMAWMIWSSFSSAQVECEVCITFEGRSQCASASGPDQEEAIRAASDIACSSLAFGRDASLACDRTRPTRVTCP